jgi:hypothetical protein
MAPILWFVLVADRVALRDPRCPCERSAGCHGYRGAGGGCRRRRGCRRGRARGLRFGRAAATKVKKRCLPLTLRWILRRTCISGNLIVAGDHLQLPQRKVEVQKS